MTQPHYVGVDVGTGSARAGIFDRSGAMLAHAKRDIALFTAPGEIAEQSSDDIWRAVVASIREAIERSAVAPRSIAGIGFDATCSLVVVGPGGSPLPVGEDPNRNIIVWMDHRATDHARRINDTRHPVLDYVGGSISPEMQTPKLLWLKENRPDTFRRAWQFFDLVDYLTWRATGSLTRSTCTLTCKWTYLAHEGRWDQHYFRTIGLHELADEGYTRIGTQTVPGGTRLADGLLPDVADAMGLDAGTPVGAGLIDAHAGGLGTIGASGLPGALTDRMAYVMGTSACTMTSSGAAHRVPGVWGPYLSAMVPDLWLNEGGQSAAGAAIDHLLRHHPAHAQAAGLASDGGIPLVEWLARRAETLGGIPAAPELIGDLHVVPEFLGNRSPHARPESRALIAGLGMDSSIEKLVGLYLAGIAGLGYGVRQIVAAQATAGLKVKMIVVSGGAARLPLVRRLLADSSGLPVVATAAEEPVLLGAAMLGAIASRKNAKAVDVMQAMSAAAALYEPDDRTSAFHANRFATFEALQLAARGNVIAV